MPAELYLRHLGQVRPLQAAVRKLGAQDPASVAAAVTSPITIARALVTFIVLVRAGAATLAIRRAAAGFGSAER